MTCKVFFVYSRPLQKILVWNRSKYKWSTIKQAVNNILYANKNDKKNSYIIDPLTSVYEDGKLDLYALFSE